jgi:hypothetical protein
MLLASSLAAGCETLAVSALNAGAPALLSHTMSGAAYRTFTTPAATVREAALAALERMGFEVTALEQVDGGELIKAQTPERRIEIGVESISAKAARLGVIAKQGRFRYDTATAAEIVTQTEKSVASANELASQGRQGNIVVSILPGRSSVPPH